jgi:uncharacterized protein YecT (DUF1311 family)
MRRLIAMAFIPLASLAASPEPNCETPTTTADVNVCRGREIDKSRAELHRYLEAAKVRMRKEEPQALTALEDAQNAWVSYSDKHCSAVYARWRGGTIRGPASAQCMIDLAKQRTYQIWVDYLTYPDRTPPILPEPMK